MRGRWNLSEVTGGLGLETTEFNKGEVQWIFDESSQELVVVNKVEESDLHLRKLGDQPNLCERISSQYCLQKKFLRNAISLPKAH